MGSYFKNLRAAWTYRMIDLGNDYVIAREALQKSNLAAARNEVDYLQTIADLSKVKADAMSDIAALTRENFALQKERDMLRGIVDDTKQATGRSYLSDIDIANLVRTGVEQEKKRRATSAKKRKEKDNGQATN